MTAAACERCLSDMRTLPAEVMWALRVHVIPFYIIITLLRLSGVGGPGANCSSEWLLVAHAEGSLWAGVAQQARRPVFMLRAFVPFRVSRTDSVPSGGDTLAGRSAT